MRYLVVAVLARRQYLALSPAYAAIPVNLPRNGAPLAVIGLFGPVFFTFTANFPRAPMADRYEFYRLGRRRSWIPAMLAACAAAQRIATLGYGLTSLFAGCARAAGRRTRRAVSAQQTIR